MRPTNLPSKISLGVIGAGVASGVSYLAYRGHQEHQRFAEQQRRESRAEDTYDIIVGVSNPTEISAGWDVYIHPRLSPEDVLPNIEAPAPAQAAQWSGAVVSVVGGFDKGKSFLLNKTVAQNFPSDIIAHTVGLSFKSIEQEGRHLILTDTGGRDNPYVVTADAEDSFILAEVTDQFISEIIFEITDIFIMVVNEITAKEQAELQRLTRRLQRSNKKFKDVLVVVNLKDVDTIEKFKIQRDAHVALYQKGELTREIAYASGPGHNVIEAKQIEFLGGDDFYQRHYFIAKEGTEAGDSINNWTYSALRSHLFVHVVGKNRGFTALGCVKAAVRKFLPSYIRDIRAEDVNIEFTNNNNPQSNRTQKRNALENARYTMKWTNAPDDVTSLLRHTILQTDRNEPRRNQDGPYIPPIEVRKFATEYVFQIEAPGVDSDSVKHVADRANSKLTIEYRVDDNLSEALERVEANRHFGVVTVVLDVPRHYSCSREDRTVNFNQGVIEIRCPKIEAEDLSGLQKAEPTQNDTGPSD